MNKEYIFDREKLTESIGDNINQRSMKLDSEILKLIQNISKVVDSTEMVV